MPHFSQPTADPPRRRKPRLGPRQRDRAIRESPPLPWRGRRIRKAKDGRPWLVIHPGNPQAGRSLLRFLYHSPSLLLRLRYLFQGTEFAPFYCILVHPSLFLLTVYSQPASNQSIMDRSHL